MKAAPSSHLPLATGSNHLRHADSCSIAGSDRGGGYPGARASERRGTPSSSDWGTCAPAVAAPEAVDGDVDRFKALVERGRQALAAGDPATAATLLRDALGLWRGHPLADLAYEAFAQPAIAQLEELRLAALEDRIEASLPPGPIARFGA
jgi:transcriptional activator